MLTLSSSNNGLMQVNGNDIEHFLTEPKHLIFDNLDFQNSPMEPLWINANKF